MPKQKRPKVVFDSAILVSAFLTKEGLSAELLNRCEQDAHLYTAEEILEEVRRVLLEKVHIRVNYLYEDIEVERFIERLRVISTLVSELPELQVIKKDPKDDKILACAQTSNAGYIITRDSHLLDLKEYQRIEILTPEKFIRIIREQKP